MKSKKLKHGDVIWRIISYMVLINSRNVFYITLFVILLKKLIINSLFMSNDFFYINYDCLKCFWFFNLIGDHGFFGYINVSEKYIIKF